MPFYQHILFDLDHTLWDYDRNANQTLTELYHEYGLHQWRPAFTVDQWLAAYHQVNREVWHQFSLNQLSKDQLREERFRRVFAQLGAEAPANLCLEIGEQFVLRCPQLPHLLPGAAALLERLRPHFGLHIVTNGFRVTQHQKLTASGIAHYFDTVVTCECCGYKKPNRGIFEYALRQIGATPDQCLMVGDNADTDVGGARLAGIDTVHYNPSGLPCEPGPTYSVTHLDQVWTLARQWLPSQTAATLHSIR